MYKIYVQSRNIFSEVNEQLIVPYDTNIDLTHEYDSDTTLAHRNVFSTKIFGALDILNGPTMGFKQEKETYPRKVKQEYPAISSTGKSWQRRILASGM